MPSQVKYSLVNASGLPAFVNWLNRNRLLVLTYHGIYNERSLENLLPETFVHVDDMDNQLQAVKKKYHFVSPGDVLSAIESGVPLLPHSALLTFDDGYEGFYRLVAPVLRSLDIGAIVFVPTKNVEENEPFWFDLLWCFVKQASSAQANWLCKKIGVSTNKSSSSLLTGLCLNAMKAMPAEERIPAMSEIKGILTDAMSIGKEVLKLFYSLSIEQLKELSVRGIVFGGHTHTHTILSSMSDCDVE